MTGDSVELLDGEAGNVRVQRIPRTERKGRVHTSTVTVAVLGQVYDETAKFRLRGDQHFEIDWFNGTVGAGGQKHNKTATCARIRHLPTGLVRTAQTRSRKNSQAEAMEALAHDLDKAMCIEKRGSVNHARKIQIGSGQRAGPKRRTFRFQEGRAYDHATGKSSSTDILMKGRLDLLW